MHGRNANGNSKSASSLVLAWNRLERSLRDTDHIDATIQHSLSTMVSSSNLRSSIKSPANQVRGAMPQQRSSGTGYNHEFDSEEDSNIHPIPSGPSTLRQDPSRHLLLPNSQKNARPMTSGLIRSASRGGELQALKRPSTAAIGVMNGTQSTKAGDYQRRMQSAQLPGYSQQQQQQQSNQLMQMKQQSVSQVSLLKSLMNIRAHSRPCSKKGAANIHIATPSDLEVLCQIPADQVDELIQKSEEVKSLRVDQILDIFTAKCRDTKVEYMPEQAVKFIEKIKKTCKQRILSLAENGLGIDSAHILGQIVVSNEHFVRLCLSRNCLGNTGAAIISEALRYNVHVIHLDLSSNNIGQEGFAVLFESLSNNQSVISLDISNKDGLNRNKLGIQGSEALEAFLIRSEMLQFLNISNTGMGEEGALRVLNGIGQNKQLVSIDLSSNELKTTFAQTIATAISGTSLLEIYLQDNAIGDAGIESMSRMFAQGHAREYGFHTLNVSRNSITSLGVGILFETLHRNTTLKKLYLDQNDFSGNRFSTIQHMMWENNTLEVLSLNECEIEAVGGDFVGIGLTRNTAIRQLFIRGNNLKDAGTNEIATGIKASETLEEIDLGMCHISDSSGLLIAEAMKVSKSLTNISLRENSLHDYTAMILLEAVRDNSNLKKCDIVRNPISLKYQEEITRCIWLNVDYIKKNLVPSYLLTMEELRIFEKGKIDDWKRQQVLDKQLRDVQLQVAEKKQYLDRESRIEEGKTAVVFGELEAIKVDRKNIETQQLAAEQSQNERLFEIDEEITATTNLIGTMRSEANKMAISKKERRDYSAKISVQLEEQQKNLVARLSQAINANRAQESLVQSNNALISQQREKIEALMSKIFKLESRGDQQASTTTKVDIQDEKGQSTDKQPTMSAIKSTKKTTTNNNNNNNSNAAKKGTNTNNNSNNNNAGSRKNSPSPPKPKVATAKK